MRPTLVVRLPPTNRHGGATRGPLPLEQTRMRVLSLAGRVDVSHGQAAEGGVAVLKRFTDLKRQH